VSARATGEKEMEQVVVFGTQVQVLHPAAPLGLNDVIPVAQLRAALRLAGFTDPDVEDAVAEDLLKAGFNVPSSWVTVVRAELVEAGIVPGRVNALQAEMQRCCVRLCGAAFARALSGTERTDSDTAMQLMRAKHVPAAPDVKADTGWSPTGQSWRDYMQKLAGWLGTVDEALASSVRAVVRDFEVEPTTLLTVRGSVKDQALGTVLRGESGIGEITRLAKSDALESGSGLWLLQEVSAVVLGPMDDVGFEAWQHPRPLSQAHMVETGMLDWSKLGTELLLRNRLAVGDPVVARNALCELIGEVPEVKPILVHLKREHGRALTNADIIARVSMDSQVWLAEHNARAAGTGPKNISAFASVDYPAGPNPWPAAANVCPNGGQVKYLPAFAAMTAENQEAALATMFGKGKGRGKGKGAILF